MADRLQDWVRRPGGPRLLVAGSYHHGGVGTGVTRARNTAVAWVRGHAAPLWHDKHSPGDRPILEGIVPEGWPELRVYVSRDGWQLAVAICRDLLNPQALHALTEAGANLVLVPAMSETLVAFGGPAAQLVGGAQALVAVANNPAQWGAGQPARALFRAPRARSPDEGRDHAAQRSQCSHPVSADGAHGVAHGAGGGSVARPRSGAGVAGLAGPTRRAGGCRTVRAHLR